MEIIKTPIEGLLVIKPKIFGDDRGYFFESWSKESFAKNVLNLDFVQDNQSRSTRGILRGLHFLVKQPQAQLITVLRGRVFDVGVDLRPESRTFGQWFGVELSDSGGARQIYMAPGFAHGFCVLSDFADLHYKTSLIYNPEDEGGLVYNDPEIGIEWPISNPSLSNRDLEYPCLCELSLDQLPHV